MRDVVFLLIVIGFFAAAVAYVRGCVALVGEAPAVDAGDEAAEAREVAR